MNAVPRDAGGPGSDQTATHASHTSSCPAPTIQSGCCYAIFAYDVGLAIELDRAEREIQETKQRVSIRHRRRAPRHFEYRPIPVRVTIATEPVALGDFLTDANVDFVLYDFGAISVTYAIPLSGPFSGLLHLSDDLYDNQALLDDSRRRVEQLLDTIASAVTKPLVADVVEDYVVYHIAKTEPAHEPEAWLTTFAEPIAQVLRADASRLAQDLIEDVLSCRISFAVDDLAVIDWNGSMLFDEDAEDIRTVFEFVNVELLEMRYLDDQLDTALDRSYEVAAARSWNPLRRGHPRAADMRLVSDLQIDSALMFEGVNNALKLVGDQYLARVYRLAVQRLHLDHWDTNILRKLATLESIYQKLADREATRRLEILEWIIIVLIALSILLSFKPA